MAGFRSRMIFQPWNVWPRVAGFLSIRDDRSVPEREVERRQQGLRLVVGLRRGGNGNIHPAQRIDLVKVDLREDDLFLDAEIVVAATVERLGGHTAEVAHARQRNVDQAIQEFPHLRPAQRDLAADRPAVADLERGHGNAGLRGDRLLTGDLGHVGHRVLEHLLVARGFAHAHVQRDLGDAGNLHHVLVAELLGELGNYLFFVEIFKARHDRVPYASTTSPVERNTRTLRPSASVLVPTRSPLFLAGLNSCTLERWIEASRSTMPPAWLAWGFGLVWRLTRFTLETNTRSPATRSTSPRCPLFLPVITRTWSPLRIRFMVLTPLQSTSGASETIFMDFSLRSSRVTGPKMRVPIGSSLLLRRTAALPSKRISEPSARRTPLAVRTTTALYTSPFFTLPRGMASFTVTLITSPIEAYRRLEPPSTLMHITSLAPLLSAADSVLCIWIMTAPSLRRWRA